MCMDPVSVMTIGAVVGAAGSLHAGASKASQARGEAALYESQAAARIQKAEFDAETSRRRYERNKGAVEARAAGTGLQMENFYDILADDSAEAALERAAIRWSAQNEATMLQYQAGAARSRAKDEMIGAVFNAAGAVVSAYSPMIRSRYASANGVSVSTDAPGYTGHLK